VFLIKLVVQCFARECLLQCRWLGYLFLGSPPGHPGLTSGKAATLSFLFFCIRLYCSILHNVIPIFIVNSHSISIMLTCWILLLYWHIQNLFSSCWFVVYNMEFFFSALVSFILEWLVDLIFFMCLSISYNHPFYSGVIHMSLNNYCWQGNTSVYFWLASYH